MPETSASMPAYCNGFDTPLARPCRHVKRETLFFPLERPRHDKERALFYIVSCSCGCRNRLSRDASVRNRLVAGSYEGASGNWSNRGPAKLVAVASR